MNTQTFDDQRHLVEKMKQRVAELEGELQHTQEVLKRKMAVEEEQRKLVLDLEREKGRLAGGCLRDRKVEEGFFI